MAKLRDLITESKYLKREFGEPLPTFKGVMKQHQVNKLKEDWWDDMDPASQAQYIKDHPGSKQAQDAGGDEPEKITKGPGGYGDRGNVRGGDQRNFGEPDDEEYFKSMMGGDEEPSDDEPKGKTPQVPKDGQAALGVVDKINDFESDSGAGLYDLQDEYDLSDDDVYELKNIGFDFSNAGEPLEDDQIAKMQDKINDLSPNTKKALESEFMSGDEEPTGRTGKELDQETITVDGKQFRRISEGVEKEPKPKYEFSEFYERFKR